MPPSPRFLSRQAAYVLPGAHRPTCTRATAVALRKNTDELRDVCDRPPPRSDQSADILQPLSDI